MKRLVMLGLVLFTSLSSLPAVAGPIEVVGSCSAVASRDLSFINTQLKVALDPSLRAVSRTCAIRLEGAYGTRQLRSITLHGEREVGEATRAELRLNAGQGMQVYNLERGSGQWSKEIAVTGQAAGRVINLQLALAHATSKASVTRIVLNFK